MKRHIFCSVCFSFILLITFIGINAQTISPLTFSEVMFTPAEGNGEFVEIYNTSATETVDLSGYKFKYYTSANNTLVAVEGGALLKPGCFAVIIQGNYDFVNGLYKTLIPAGTVILKTSGNSFGSSGMANTTSRDINLINPAGEIIDTYTYSADNTAGYSDEKIELTKNNFAANWKNSTTLHGTPGKKNSVSPVDFDLAVSFTGIMPAFPKAEDSLIINITVKNIGKRTASNFVVELYNDVDNNSIGDAEEKLYEESYLNLSVSDSIIIEKSFYALLPGSYTFLASTVFEPDENVSNNTVTTKVNVYEKPVEYNDIVVNEVMYAPSGDEPEWIEIYNRSTRSINLTGWKIGDKTSLVTISSSDLILKPNEYLIISDDVSITNYYSVPSPMVVRALPSLSNSGDDIILRDNTNRTIDSLKYLPAWGGSGGKSLERISVWNSSIESVNWKTSQSNIKATPGKINSVSLKDYDLAVKSFYSLESYAELGKNIKLKSVIENFGRKTAETFTIKLFHDKNDNLSGETNELIQELQKTILDSSSVLEVEFTVNEFVLGNNRFIILIDYVEDQFNENNSLPLNIVGVEINEQPGDLVINEIMYAPASPEPEWIEIFNKSGKQIDLKGYQIADDASKIKVVSISLMIKPEEYVVFARDTSIFSIYLGLTNVVIYAFPTLNNSGDRLVLLDSLNRVIDSLEYKSSWGGSGGKSLEKCDVFISLVDSSNWKTSLVQKGGTPGRVNSVTKKNYDGAVTNIFFNPSYPFAGEEVKITSEIINAGKKGISGELILYELKENREKEFIERSQLIELESGIILRYEFAYSVKSIFSKHTYYVELEDSADEDLTNNNYTSTILPGYKHADLLVNEIMYNPVNGEPEWIEVYNNADYDIILEDWTITDILTTPVKTKIKSTVLPSQEFLVISKDTSIVYFHKNIPSQILINGYANLNNDADGVVIKDWRGVTIDSVRYDKSWGGEYGKSIERIFVGLASNNKSNWSSSKDLELSTPGRINSVTQKENDLVLTKISTVPEMPSFNDEILLSAVVHNKGLFEANEFSVEFYFVEEGDTVFFCKSYAYNLKPLDSLTLCSVNKTKFLEMKTVLCRLVYDVDEEESNNVLTCVVRAGYEKNSVLVSEIMYNPLDGEPEWVEIINFSNAPVNLKNWSISDIISPTKKVITDKDIFLEVGEYAVLTPDTNIFAYYPPSKYFQVKFGSLGNTSDGVVIYDYRNFTIDSVMYNSKWGGEKGYSLERISYNISGNDSTNWATSLSADYATPGIKNSLTEIPAYKNNALVINEVMYDPADGNSDFLEFYNTTNDSIQLGGLTLQIGNNKKTKLSSKYFIAQPYSHIIIANDSSIINNYQFLGNEENIVLINNSISLSNSGAEIVLKDLKGNMIDSLYYLPIWHNKNILTTKNKSLERLNHNINSNDGTNWSTSVDNEGATPGRKNSVFTEIKIAETKVMVSPNPFSPDNDGFEDFTIINFNLAEAISQVRIRVFDSNGRLVRTIINNSAAASQNSIIFNGLDDNGNPLRIGIYILLIEAATEYGTNETIKTPVVVARKLR